MALRLTGMDAFAREVTAAFVQAVTEQARELPDLMTALVLENMHNAKNPGGINQTDKLYDVSGDLLRSLIKGQPGNLTSVRASLDGIEFEFGIDTDVIPYAAIHEFGGTITITDRMRGFFWARYAETGDDKWRFMALTKKTVITIPKRAYFTPAIDELRTDALPEIMTSIYNHIARLVN